MVVVPVGVQDVLDLTGAKSEFSYRLEEEINALGKGGVDKNKPIVGIDEMGGDLFVAHVLKTVDDLKWLHVKVPGLGTDFGHGLAPSLCRHLIPLSDKICKRYT
jgi:hypothetical protein